MKQMNILAVGAHPDDIEFGCGGTLTKYADRGHNVYLLVMTKGQHGGAAEVRTEEQAASLSILGARDIYWGDLIDTHLAVDKNTIDKIESVIACVHPDLIFCHFTDDTHQDHRHLAQMTVSATRYIRNVLFYEGPTTQNFNPYVFVDICDTLERKIAALEAHRSQVMKTNIEGVSILDIARSSASFRGIQGRVQFAEAFFALRLFINV